MVVLAYLGNQCTEVHAAGWTCWLLRPFLWSRASGLMRLRNGSDKGRTSNFVQISEKGRRRPWQWLDKRSVKEAWVQHGKIKLSETEKGETGEEQSHERSHLFYFFDIKGIVHKEIVMANQPVDSPATASKCAKNSSQTLGTKELAVASRQRTVSHFLFHQGIFCLKQHDCHPHKSYFSVFPRLKVKLETKRPPFWHNWGDQGTVAGSAEHPHRTRLPGCFKKWKKRWEWYIRAEGDYFEGDGG
jgi:hypothetical protein